MLETLITITLDSMESLVKHGVEADKGNLDYFSHGADDTMYDYVPNGLDTIAWLASAIGYLHYITLDNCRTPEDDAHFRERYTFPALQDCVSATMRDHIVYLGIKLGYSVDQLIDDGCCYEFEEGFNETTETFESFIAKYETNHGMRPNGHPESCDCEECEG